MSDNSPLIIKVEVHEEMYQNLFKMLEKVPARLRAEKLRSLANLANMIEMGLIDNLGEMVIKKINSMNLSITNIINDGNKVDCFNNSEIEAKDIKIGGYELGGNVTKDDLGEFLL